MKEKMERHIRLIIDSQKLVLSRAQDIIDNSTKTIRENEPGEYVRIFKLIGKNSIVTEVVEWDIKPNIPLDAEGTHESKAINITPDGYDLLVQDAEKTTLVKAEDWEKKLNGVLVDSYSRPLKRTGRSSEDLKEGMVEFLPIYKI